MKIEAKSDTVYAVKLDEQTVNAFRVAMRASKTSARDFFTPRMLEFALEVYKQSPERFAPVDAEVFKQYERAEKDGVL